MFEGSEESGGVEGLGVIPGMVKKFDTNMVSGVVPGMVKKFDTHMVSGSRSS